MVAAGALVLAPVSPARNVESLSLNIAFFANGSISVTLPDGTALGSTNGTAQVVPAGYYNLLFSGPGGCSALPYFHLTGPGVNISTDMNEGTQSKAANNANLEPSSTYVWTDDAVPGVTHSFTTSAVVEGSPPSPGTGSTSGSSSGPGVSYPSIIGSDVVPSRGKLTATISSTGKLTLSYRGKPTTSLRAGKYTLSVVDRYARSGLTLRRPKHASLLLAAPGFSGSRSTSVNLTAGNWFFAAAKGSLHFSFAVH